MRKQYIVKLSHEERKQLNSLLKRGKHGVRVIKRARVLLQSDKGRTDDAIAEKVEVSTRTIQRIRERYCEEGLKPALEEAPRSGTPPALNNRQEARLVAIACTDPPKGYRHWTVELLQQRMVKDKVVSHVSIGTVFARLTERGLKPWREKNVVHTKDHA